MGWKKIVKVFTSVLGITYCEETELSVYDPFILGAVN
jgi:hypothetical protein